MSNRAMFLGLVLIVACDPQLQLPPPRQAARNVASVPAPAPRAEHPLDRIPPKPSPDEPVRDPAVKPRLIESVPPEYTAEARRARVQGSVILEVVVEKDGRVSAARVLKPLPFGLAEKAVDAVKQSRYSPGRNARGAPVRSILNAIVSFSLP